MTNARDRSLLLLVLTFICGSEIGPRSMLVVAQAAGVVTSCTAPALGAALAGGGHVTFACDGTIDLPATLVVGRSTVLDGAGHTIVISGHHSVGVFKVTAGVSFMLNNLTVANGQTDPTTAAGGGLYNGGGNVTISNCTLAGNVAASLPGVPGAAGHSGTMGPPATASAGPGPGGGATSAGVAGARGRDASGGAIYNAGGSLTLRDCTPPTTAWPPATVAPEAAAGTAVTAATTMFSAMVATAEPAVVADLAVPAAMPSVARSPVPGAPSY